jgi:hypothetical protein
VGSTNRKASHCLINKEKARQVPQSTCLYCASLKHLKKKKLDDSYHYQSRVSSVGIALGYGLDDRGSRGLFPAGAGNFSLHRRVQNGSGAHPVSYSMGTRVSFPRGKAVGE